MALPRATDVEVIGSGMSGGITVGESATEKVSLYGVTPVVQRTAAVATSAVGTASSTDVTTVLKAAVIDIMNTLEAIGAWNGSDA